MTMTRAHTHGLHVSGRMRVRVSSHIWHLSHTAHSTSQAQQARRRASRTGHGTYACTCLLCGQQFRSPTQLSFPESLLVEPSCGV
eukprot:CAMPEP_0206166164 /NCGR_PEP_ID=MMETSP1474-20131121/23094_1 /ASSEMBLY_ACC=CAM_ASM_001110 /TAXON_ID=97495 /ORGANISM="Imantonia sp., Strain RCC918" /LENGTH=84 /DNA_ID=CAMNT_0053570007 /DNA_START=62 /DNA_END=312 /DNA_ORIENTATION=-